MKISPKYRSRQIANKVVAFSISYERDSLLARGMGLEHLRELLVRLARPILRQGANLAYGGHWKETDDNLLYDLLRLISAEQEEAGGGGLEPSLPIGRLYNHSAWPSYLEVTPLIEAKWIGCCRVVRIDQARAGLAPVDIVPDDQANGESPRVAFNKAVTLGAMRRLMMTDMTLEIPDAPPEQVPGVMARVLLGGKVTEYAGFLPGIFEEALITIRLGRPTYILGGFGGAAEILARAIASPAAARPPELTLDWHRQNNERLRTLLRESDGFPLPEGALNAEHSFAQLSEWIEKASIDPSGVLHTGLDDHDTRELLATRNIATAIRLVRQGLANTNQLPHLPG